MLYFIVQFASLAEIFPSNKRSHMEVPDMSKLLLLGPWKDPTFSSNYNQVWCSFAFVILQTGRLRNWKFVSSSIERIC